MEERLKLAIFIDFDNIQIGVKDTLKKEFDVSVVLEALKERGEVVAKLAYGDWNRAGEQSRRMSQHAVQMVQRNVTPRGDKNAADINLALDALEMAFTRHHINTFVIVGGDSDFIPLVEKLKQYDKRVLVVGGRAFTSLILQRNCHEFIAYENLLKSAAGGDGSKAARTSRARERAAPDSRPLSAAMPNVRRALKILAEREVAPQVGLLKSTLLQLDPTFSERDYGTGSFLEFIQRMHRAGLVHLRRTDRGHLVELPEAAGEPRITSESPEEGDGAAAAIPTGAEEIPAENSPTSSAESTEAMSFLRQALTTAAEKAPNRPLYLRQIRQGLRSADQSFDARGYDFRAILNLLHQAQREGFVRLQRDRKGVWRILPLSSAAVPPSAVPAGPEAVGEQERPPGNVEPAEGDVARDEVTEPLLIVADAQGPLEEARSPASLEAEPPPADRRGRRLRTQKASRKGTRRRPFARRKGKEISEG